MSIVLWRCLHKQNYCDFIDRWFIFQWVTDMYKANIIFIRKRKSEWKFYGSILSCLWDRHNLRLLNYYKFSEWQKYKFFSAMNVLKRDSVHSDSVLWFSIVVILLSCGYIEGDVFSVLPKVGEGPLSTTRKKHCTYTGGFLLVSEQ